MSINWRQQALKNYLTGPVSEELLGFGQVEEDTLSQEEKTQHTPQCSLKITVDTRYSYITKYYRISLRQYEFLLGEDCLRLMDRIVESVDYVPEGHSSRCESIAVTLDEVECWEADLSDFCDDETCDCKFEYLYKDRFYKSYIETFYAPAYMQSIFQLLSDSKHSAFKILGVDNVVQDNVNQDTRKKSKKVFSGQSIWKAQVFKGKTICGCEIRTPSSWTEKDLQEFLDDLRCSNSSKLKKIASYDSVIVEPDSDPLSDASVDTLLEVKTDTVYSQFTKYYALTESQYKYLESEDGQELLSRIANSPPKMTVSKPSINKIVSVRALRGVIKEGSPSNKIVASGISCISEWDNDYKYRYHNQSRNKSSIGIFSGPNFMEPVLKLFSDSEYTEFKLI